MNQRIKELAKQSYIMTKDENSFDCMVFSKQRFAELIIRECSHIIEKKDHKLEPADHIYLLKAFGIDG